MTVYSSCVPVYSDCIIAVYWGTVTVYSSSVLVVQ